MTPERAVAETQGMMPPAIDYEATMAQAAAFCAASPQERGCDQLAAQLAQLRQAEADLARTRAEYEGQAGG